MSKWEKAALTLVHKLTPQVHQGKQKTLVNISKNQNAPKAVTPGYYSQYPYPHQSSAQSTSTHVKFSGIFK